MDNQAFSKLIELAAQIASRKGMPSPDDWPGWSARTPQKLWHAAQESCAHAHDQCGDWAYNVRQAADLAQAEIDRLRAEVAALREDAERIDFISALADQGLAPALVFDDDGRWAVSSSGAMSFPPEGGHRSPVWISVCVDLERLECSIREAIDSAMK